MTEQRDDAETNVVSERRTRTWSDFSTTRFGEENRWPWLYSGTASTENDGDDEGSDPSLERTWYWESDQNKAYYPCHVGDETVHFVTVWHRDEVDGALEDDGLVPVETLGPERSENQFVSGPLDSFRLLPEKDVQAYEAVRETDTDTRDGEDEQRGESAE